VAAWMADALQDVCALSIVTLDTIDRDRINAYYGTSVDTGKIVQHTEAPRLERVLNATPFRLALARLAVLLRAARRLDREVGYDLVISANNEMDFGRPGLQYVHCPTLHHFKPDARPHWAHRIPPLVSAYRRVMLRAAGFSIERALANRTLVNSQYIARRFRALYGVEPEVLHPPVQGPSCAIPWSQRKDEFVCLGRLAPEKEIPKVVGILKAVRARGHAVTLRIVGSPAHERGFRSDLRDLFARHASWIRVDGDLLRGELADRVSRCRYGIHGMVGEHFGIAVAEMQRAGCLVFAPDRGGPAEILAGDRRLLYSDPSIAVEKIHRVLRDGALREDTRRACAARCERFTADRFVTSLRRLVESPWPSP
jgi:glycosyltransferase involved in cell wall biosynthesis